MNGLLLAHGFLESPILTAKRFTLLGLGERDQDFVLFEGLRDVVIGANLHGFDREIHRAVRAHQDHGRQGRAGLELCAKLETGHAAHSDVGENEVGVEAFELLQGGLGAFGGFDLIIVLFEQRAEHDPDVFFVVDDQDTAHELTLYFLHSRRLGMKKIS